MREVITDNNDVRRRGDSFSHHPWSGTLPATILSYHDHRVWTTELNSLVACTSILPPPPPSHPTNTDYTNTTLSQQVTLGWWGGKLHHSSTTPIFFPLIMLWIQTISFNTNTFLHTFCLHRWDTPTCRLVVHICHGLKWVNEGYYSYWELWVAIYQWWRWWWSWTVSWWSDRIIWQQ